MGMLICWRYFVFLTLPWILQESGGVAAERCEELGTPSGAELVKKTGSTQPGATWEFRCQNGYSFLEGDLTRTCLQNGTWSGQSIICRLFGCGGNFTSDNGTIKFPVEGDKYPHSTNCTWVINNNSTKGILVKFKQFKLELDPRGCRYDYLKVWGDRESWLRRTYCGSSKPGGGTIRIPSGRLFLQFRSDSSTSDEGFELSWTSEVMCSKPSTPPTVALYNSTDIHSLLQDEPLVYGCRAGFSLTFGNLTRTCQDDGTWSGTPPICAVLGCGAYFNSSNGTIAFPVEGKQYAHNTDCTWTIAVGPNKGIVAQFTGFHLEQHSECSFDYLEIREGTPRRTSVIGKYCGDKLPNQGTIKSSKGQLQLHFHSDSGASFDGFQMSWYSEMLCPEIRPPAGAEATQRVTYATVNTTWSFKCRAGFLLMGGSLNRTCQEDGTWSGQPPVCQVPGCGGWFNSSRGSIKFPADGDKYPLLVDCTWTIDTGSRQGIVVTFNTFQLEDDDACRYDYLRVHLGTNKTSPLLGKYCGSTLPNGGVITSDAGQLYLHFHSDTSASHDGFQLTWLSETLCPLNPKATNADTRSDEASTPRGNTVNRTITYTCKDGHVLTAGNLTRTCQEDGTWSGQPPVCQILGCGGRFNSESGSIQFPVMGRTYPHGVDCEWIIDINSTKGIILSFTSFKLEQSDTCEYDYMTIYLGTNKTATQKGTYCGSSLPNGGSIVSTSGQLLLVFHSDGSTSYDGFKLTWRSEIMCPYLQTPDNVAVRSEGIPYGVSVPSGVPVANHRTVYECKTGYSLTEGNLTRTCQEDGSWSGAPPVCQVSGCGGWFNTTSGAITFPTGTGKYPDSMECTWIINAKTKKKKVPTATLR